MNDLISRQAALKICRKYWHPTFNPIMEEIEKLPSAQPEIEYRDCANAMLRMWMDNVVTDGEYNRIMAKLNVHWGKG